MARPLELDLTGQRMGRLTVIGRDLSRGPKVYWKCVCDCGNTTSVQTFNLIFGMTHSCGCYRVERQRELHNRKD